MEIIDKLIKYKALSWALVILLFVIVILLFLCARGVISNNFYIIEKLGIECGCKEKDKNIGSIRDTIKVYVSERDTLEKQLKAARERIQFLEGRITEFSDNAQNLIVERDSLLTVIKEIELRLKGKQNEIDSLQKIIDNFSFDSEVVVSDSLLHTQFRDTIDSLRAIKTGLLKKNNILENVYITNLEVKKINDITVMIKYSLVGVDCLQTNGYKVEPDLMIKVRDLKTDEHIEYLEKNPSSHLSNRTFNKCPIVYAEAKKNVFAGICYFTNTQIKPFKGTGLLNIGTAKEYGFEFYLPEFNRPLSIVPRRARR